jgi:SAM-dependent methyltransferase
VSRTPRKLHVGCFDQAIRGWINLDVTPHLFVARVPGLAAALYWAGLITNDRYRQHRQGIFRQVRYLNAAKKFPYRAGTIECIYSSHLLEHLYPRQADLFLRECRRVLRPGGVLRLAIPDLDRLVASYDPARAEAFAEQVFESRRQRDKNAHHWHYNQDSLGRALQAAGFWNVRRCGPRQGICPDVERLDSRPESLFMEAVK